jgi:hypothetical protein
MFHLTEGRLRIIDGKAFYDSPPQAPLYADERFYVNQRV